MSGRGRAGILAMAAVAVVVAVLTARGCGDAPSEPSDAPRHSASVAAPSEPSERRPRVRASVAPEVPEAASATQPPGEPFLVDGWPAAQVIVRRPDGHVAPGATVYVHRADADSPPSLSEVVRGNVDAEGKFTLVAPEPGRYDVGAFDGPGFATLLTDVEFPAHAPVEVVLPETERLEIRREGDLPQCRVTIRPAAPARVTAFPGRRESKETDFWTDRPLLTAIEVPRDVPLRIDSNLGVVVDPPTMTAPGAITLRRDGTRPMDFYFAFTGATQPVDDPVTYDFHVAVVGGADAFDTALEGRIPDGASHDPVRTQLHCPPGSVRLRWELRGVASGFAVVDTANEPALSRFRVEAPVPDWKQNVNTVGLVVSGGDADTAMAVTEGGARLIDARREVRLSARGVSHVAAAGPGLRLVADPVSAKAGQIVDLRLVPGGIVRIEIEWSRPIRAGWPITVERADGLPLIERPGNEATHLAARARIDAPAVDVGPLAAGDVELVFRLAGREFGRKRVTVHADEIVEVAAPPIIPPSPR